MKVSITLPLSRLNTAVRFARIFGGIFRFRVGDSYANARLVGRIWRIIR